MPRKKNQLVKLRVTKLENINHLSHETSVLVDHHVEELLHQAFSNGLSQKSVTQDW